MRVTIPYKPRDLSVHERLEAARFSVVAAHRRYGKTVLAVNHTIKGALTCNKPRGSFAYVAPFRNQAKAVAWDYLKYYTSPIPGRTVNESELSIMLPNGARIRIYGADNPDSLRGLYFDGVVLDEVADMKPEVWGEIIQPALADREGWALFIGTPHGINLFSELYYRALERQQKGDPLWCAMSFPVTGTTSLPPAEVERLRAELSENAWRQEMLCDFTASSDDILIPLPDVLEAEARQLAWDDVGGMPVILGVDVARFGADSSVIVRRQGLKVDGPV
ncbi:MAG: terminase family protein, partial [Desulfovibrio piger]